MARRVTEPAGTGDAADAPATRRPIGSIVAPGFGYLYAGRPLLAFVPLPAIVGIVAVAGQSRWILEPDGYYTTFVLALTVFVVSIVHPTIIAFRARTMAAT